MTAEKISFEQKLALLKAEYAKQLPGKLSEISEKWRDLQKEWKHETIVTLYRNVHTLTGTSGTFGFNEISTLARSIEIMLKPLATHHDETAITNTELNNVINEKIQQLITLGKTI